MDEGQLQEKLEKGKRFYSSEKFWGKVRRYGKKAGGSVVYSVLLLYYTLQKPEVPKKTKATIIGALGYFILPLDLIPDVAAGVGYTDDLTVIGAALIQVAMYIDEETKEKAKEKLSDWFGGHADTTAIDQQLLQETDDE
ncbi:hypothetical protein N781_14980 [Pontibacillus halophilus JSM 076056 = DSM 19796]|uniref:DUF1232 domain-containing protein n=1 Tax=Pontibacillus halophilus JSM 076056 = DSM 19796 TaxID=1385510 RepID=A0A0A5I9W7_9BACI|nr:YkvA family protein [Pontibacillus halophilus]KGX92627.1 hypothetical protein N781_14980 [Pontibacillus halophilus JSM 076056 = DSM 19796]